MRRMEAIREGTIENVESLTSGKELLDNLLEGCQIVDFDWKFVYLNDAALVHAHKPLRELIGRTMMESYPGIENTAMFAALRRVMESRKAERMENEFTYPDGRQGWFELHIQPCPEGVLVLSQDVTDSKLALERAHLQLKRLDALHHIDRAITSNVDLAVVLESVLDQIAQIANVDAVAILLFDPFTLSLQASGWRGFKKSSLEDLSIKMGEGISGTIAVERRTVSIDDLVSEPGFIRKTLVQKEGFVSYVGSPLVSKGQTLGVLEAFHRSKLSPDRDWLHFFNILVGQAAIAIDHIRTFSDLQKANLELMMAYDRTISGWAKTLELRDFETEGHSKRVTELAVRLAQALSYRDTELVNIRRGAMLHDIGKMGIPDEILLKPGKLTEAEWEIMRKHPVIAYDLLTNIEFLRPALDIPHYHHEKWDGSGYPEGLKGNLIPEPARIFAVVDVWDALRSDRPYRKAWSDQDTFKYIKECTGTSFDPRVVEEFERHVIDDMNK